MSSSRFPGKMLVSIHGKPLLERVIERVSGAKGISKILIATSEDTSDDVIASYCADHHIPCFRGYLDNVAGRFVEVIKQEKAEAFIRINGDSPLMDPEIIDVAIGHFKLGNPDIVTNVFNRSFPKGQSVEIIRSSAFIEAYSQMTDSPGREHITKIFHDHADRYAMVSFTSGGDFGSVNLCIDTVEDKDRIERMIAVYGADKMNWRQIAELETAG